MPTAPGYAAISVRLQSAAMSRPAFITFGVNPVEVAAEFIATQMRDSWLASGSINTRLDSNVTATEFTARVGQDGTEDIVGTAINSTPGGATLSSPPPNVALLVHKMTSRGGRRGRGRIFFPWLSNEVEIDEAGIIPTANLVAHQTALNAWLASMSGASMPMVLLHKAGKSVMGAPDVVTALKPSTLVATQKRRLARR